MRHHQAQPGVTGEEPGRRAGPVNRPGTGPEPQCVTTGTRASASRPHASSSSGSFGSKSPTCRWHLKTRAPWPRARRTSAAADGSAKNVAVCRQSGVLAAKPAAQSLSERAIPGLCGYSIAVNASTPNERSAATRACSSWRYTIGHGLPISGPAASKYAHTAASSFSGMKWVCTSITLARPARSRNARARATSSRPASASRAVSSPVTPDPGWPRARPVSLGRPSPPRPAASCHDLPGRPARRPSQGRPPRRAPRGRR